jgi:hypothetical protein
MFALMLDLKAGCDDITPTLNKDPLQPVKLEVRIFDFLVAPGICINKSSLVKAEGAERPFHNKLTHEPGANLLA